ncbi:DNA cytosine methyltransferase [Candidatus Palauibacter sp.]|uniref:DNA cytosine methyltransferase n=1 Tax=Candidatus Palauibacter sp. TaxID=3101350 RepID=UPI003C6F9076
MTGRPIDDKTRTLREHGCLNPRPERVREPRFLDNAFFDPRDLVQVKYEMLRRVREDGESVSGSAARFGLSRPTFYLAQRAYEAGGLPALLPERPGPRRPHKLSAEVVAALRAARAQQRFAKSGTNFKRVGFEHPENGSLLSAFIRLVVAFQPRAFLVENVLGLRDVDDGVQLAFAMEHLRGNGYNVDEPWILDAANYGVPQHRTRLFLAGHRGRGGLRPPPPHETHVGAGSVLPIRGTEGLPNSETRKHLASSVLRYMKVQYGKREQLGRVDRLDPTVPAKTVIAGGTKGGGRSHLHPEVPRTLSARECARLQSFPDDFVFCGPSARQFTQVGNAVPPVLAAQLGKSIRSARF